MESRKKAQSGGRRRRVLREDPAKKKRGTGSTSRRTTPNLQLYETEAITSLQPRLTELIPQRKRALTACLGIGTFLVASMQALFLIRQNHLSELPASSTTPLHLMGAGTLSAWCASLILAFAALVSLVIFSIRRHKVDDYRGRFGMWLTVSLACLLASADASTGLHTTFNACLAQFTEYKPFGWVGSWWAICGGLLGVYLLVRMLVDSWRSRGTVAGLFITVAIYMAATLFFYRKLRLGTDQKDMMAHTSLLMYGHVMLSFSLLTYARYVYREAAGVIGKKKRKSTKKKSTKSSKEKSASRFGSWFSGFTLSNGKPSQPKPKPAPAVSQTEREAEENAEDDEYELDELERITAPEDSGRPLDKRTRKRLKKQTRRAA